MKYLNTCIGLSAFMACFSVSSALALDSSPVASSATASSKIISCDFPITGVPDSTASQTAFDEYSWRMFTALSQPASDIPGKPDCAKGLGSTSDTVWRSYKFMGEIFLPNATNPGPWDSMSTIKEKMFGATSKVSSEVESTIDQPVGGWLIDQRGNPTYYQIAANEVSYNYIVSNDLYNKNTVDSFALVDYPDFSTEIKASWRILEADDNAERYMTTPATVATFDSGGKPTGDSKDVTLGLVGLHIMTKATGYPQWIWSTFEQIDNVSTDPAIFSSYYNPKATPKEVNQSPCANHASPCVPIEGRTFQSPDPLTRVTPISSATAAVNTAAQAELNATFLQYYDLVTTQRATDPNDPGNPAGSPAPGVSANTTMESYNQSTSSCMDCHSTASITAGKKLDYSFLLIHAQEPEPMAK